MHLLRALVVLPIVSALLLGCASTRTPIHTVEQVDLPRYMGDWYVISEIPNLAEKNCYDSVESYALRPDGDIDNWFSCRKNSFEAPMNRITSARAKVADPNTHATWHLRFYKILSVDYVVLDLDPGYQWVVVGHPSHRYAWIMARSNSLPAPLYESILARTQAQGYDPQRFVKVPQSALGAAAVAH
jgi:apolipoprotein D and lipocalin family protein